MKEEALKLADELQVLNDAWENKGNERSEETDKVIDMIRKLVAELDKQGEPVALCCHLDEYHLLHIANKMGLDPMDKMFLSLPLYTAPQTKQCSGFCGEYECKENQDNCKRVKSNTKNVAHTTQKPLRTSKEIIKSIENELIRGKEIIKKRILGK